jgi:hypothetical protein
MQCNMRISKRAIMGNKMRISENVPAEILPTSVPLGILWAVILLVAGGLLVVLMSVPLTPPSDPKPHTFVDAFFFLFRPLPCRLVFVVSRAVLLPAKMKLPNGI